VISCFRDSTKDCPRCGKESATINPSLSDVSALKGVVNEATNGSGSQKQELKHADAEPYNVGFRIAPSS
jgi:hypothetical protein